MSGAEELTTTYTYDALGRVIAETKSGGGIRPDTMTTTTYDPEDRILSRTVTSGNISGLLGFCTRRREVASFVWIFGIIDEFPDFVVRMRIICGNSWWCRVSLSVVILKGDVARFSNFLKFFENP